MLVHMARLARLLPALALRVRGPYRGTRFPRVKRSGSEEQRAGEIRRVCFESFCGTRIGGLVQRVCGAAKLIGGRTTES
jgi:hypothetical protein